jgi:NAD(P)-dependent dehydrogenase (short-subunit alcohol dehydrogenase family)
MWGAQVLSLVLLVAGFSKTWSFAPHSTLSYSQRANVATTFMSSDGIAEGDESSRRGFFKKIAGGAALTGIFVNGVSVQGPSPFIPANDSLQNKLIVITGGNTGLGLESGKRLAAAGATIVLTSRSAEKGARAVQTIKDYVKDQNGKTIDNVYTLPLDLCDLESVKKFPLLLKNSDAFKTINHVDVLLNNAGVMAVPDLQLTKDNFEKTFQSNHLGHFALTAGLEPLLNTAGSRVVNVSSMAYLIAQKGLDMTNLNGEVEYKPWDAYGASKLENILFTEELQKRADAAGKKITTVTLHPGAVRTDLARFIIGEDKYVSMQDASPSFTDVLKALPAFYFTKSVERGANSQIYLSAFQGENVGGTFFFNMKENKLQPAALDMDQAKDLWRVSEEMSGVKFNL